jgi:integrase
MTTTRDSQHPLYPALERAAIAAWSGEMAFTQRALAEAIAPELQLDPGRIAQALPQYLGVLSRDGVYVGQRARFGAKTHHSQLTSPQCFNWSAVDPSDASLRSVVEPYLVDAGVSPQRKHALRSAIRFALELATKCSDAALLRACERVPAEDLYALPRRVYDAALSRPAPLAKQTAKNHRSVIRAAMLWAGGRRLVPIVFPQIWLDDAWERDKDRFFPLEVTGPTSQKVASWRSAWSVFGQTFAAMHPELPNEIGAVSREIAENVIARMQTTDGRYAMGYQARGALRYLAAQHAAGPFVEASPVDAFRVPTPTGPRPALYLRSANGEAGDGDWNAFFALLAEHRLPDGLTEFLRWYRDYVTLPGMEIITRKDKFPPRRERTKLDENTLNERLPALRAFIGAAVYELKPAADAAPLGLTLDPTTLTPEELFGHRFSRILGAMVAWWNARALVLPQGAMGKSGSGALRQMVIALGMIALALYERLRHQRRLHIATDESASGMERVDWRQEEEAQKSPAEAAAWEAYRDSTRMADALAGDTRGRNKGKRKKRQNDFKNIRRIIQNTPPSYWIGLQRCLLEQMRRAKREREDRGYAYHNAVMNAFLLGALISTGCRIEELCHVRLDIQAKELRSTRIIRLRAVDRKNGKDHDVLVQPEFVPDDLLEEYLDRARPWFMAGKPAEAAGRAKRPASWQAVPRKRAAVARHEWLLVSTSGREFGCREETVEGGSRRKQSFKRRCAQAGQRFKVQMSAAARRAGMFLPGHRYEFGPHAVRGACGYGVFLMHGDQGIQKAAHYLGDEESTVREAYSSINGIHVDSSCLVGIDTRPQLSTSAKTLSPRGSRLHDLVDALERGDIDEPAYLVAVEKTVNGPGTRNLRVA